MAPPEETEATATAGGNGAAGFTRLCVKNVPKHVDEKRLRQHFAAQGGQVTDAKLLRTKTGESRKMAFVGFRSEAEARAALKYFHGTFLDTSRLVVEAAVPKGAAALPRPWSRHSEGSSRFEKAQEKRVQAQAQAQQSQQGKKRKLGEGAVTATAEEDDEEKEKEDPKQRARRVGKEEYLATMMPRSRTQFWANDEVGVATEEVEQGKKQKKVRGGGEASSASSSEEEEDDGGDVESSNSGSGGADDQDGSDDEEASLPEPEPAPASGLDFLRSKVKKGLEAEIDGGGAVAAASAGVSKQPAEEDEEEEDADSEDEDEEEESSGCSEDDEEEEEEEEGETDDGQSPVEQEEEEEGAAAENDKEKEAQGGSKDRDLPNVEETGRLFIRNLPFSATEDDLTAHLEQFGQLSEVHLPLDDAKRPKGFAFATFVLPEDAKRALEALDGQAFQGRLLHVLPAKEPPKDPLAELDPAMARTYKEKKEIERRRRAGEEQGWNASFMRSETVVDAVADRLGVAKGAVLDREGDGMAVKLALGETFLLAENREFFEKEGVDLSALEGAAKSSKGGKKGGAVQRSKTTVLVKNLPYSTAQEDLTKLFGKFGALGRVLLPPSRSIGLVEFLEAAEARRAFKGLAYKRFQHVPLYLEWAPLNTFTTGPAASSASASPAAAAAAEAEAPSKATPPAAPGAPAEKDKGQEAAAAAVEAEDGPEGSFTLFVKNLNFATTDEALAAAFKRRTEGVRAVNIPKKTAPAAKKQRLKPATPQPSPDSLSMGYGFVEYGTAAQARAALKAMDGALLDGHKLQCKLSDKRLTARAPKASADAAGRKRTKLVVRNVAFQATARELKELFGSFGKLKTVRIPKKFDGSHRGFAFVEFLTAQEAAGAYRALASTHLYGRHLVIEWAEDKDDIDSLRDKAKQDARRGAASALSSDASAAGGGPGGKKRKAGDDFDGDEEF